MKKQSLAIVICLGLFVLLIRDLYCSAKILETTEYQIASNDISAPFRVVQLSDLHDSVFGEANEKLLSAVADTSPDLILLTGDMVDQKNWNEGVVTSLISDLKNIAPVYVSLGNQELEIEQQYGLNMTDLFEDAGAAVLEYSYKDIEANGQQLRLGGIYGYCQNEAYAAESGREKESDFLREFQDTNRYKILLCHMPVCWLEGNSLYDWGVDTVFSGHAHGGQIRFPFIGGLYAPDQGWFPGQLCGVYDTNEDDFKEYKEKNFKWLDDMKKAGKPIPVDAAKYEKNGYLEYSPSHLVLSRGLGSGQVIPRFNNVPEIVVVDFVPEE